MYYSEQMMYLKKDKILGVRQTREQFISQAKAVHGERYDYSKVVHEGNLTPVEIVCKLHGSFYQLPKSHKRGSGCPTCVSYENKTPKQWFLDKAKEVHGDTYDYSKVAMVDKTTPITVICRTHGEYQIQPVNHLTGATCRKCKDVERRLSTKDFIKQATVIHKGKFSYEKVNCDGGKSLVDIFCREHNDYYQQRADLHLRGCGCPICKVERTRMTTEGFIKKVTKVHNGKYNYSKVVYTDNRGYVDIICPKHSVFSQAADVHIQGGGCPECSRESSKAEREILSYVREIKEDVLASNRRVISPFELDISVPKDKLAIEYNGVVWHSEKFGKDSVYHLNKTERCNEKGYRLIHIWEDDFTENPERELEFIKHALGVNDSEKIYARKTTLKPLDKKVAKSFLDKHHIQGSVGASEFLGAYYEDKLISVTAFTYKQNKSYVELVRHVNHKDYQVLGSLGKATKHFSKECKLDIISFCDLARFDGNSYLKAGFVVDKKLKPDYKYVINNKREHKFNWRKAQIKKKLPEIYDESLTEKEMMELAGIPRIWDCGKLRLIYKYDES